MIFHARPAIRRSLFVGLGLLGVIATAAIITAVVLVRSDLRPYAEQFASKHFGHKVTIQRLTIAWGNPIAVDIEDVHVANPLGASTPDIVAIQRLRGDVALWPLMHGELRLDHVVLDHPVIDLEHNSDGLANWKGSPSGAAEPGPTPLPVRFIGAMHVHDGTLTFTSTAHHKLLIHLADADLRAANDTAPITINASGSYNDLPVRAVVTIESFAALSSVPHPVTMDIDVSSTHTTLKLTSTMTDPLGFDGVKGHLDIVADPLKDIIKAVGMTDFPDRKLTLSGAIDKQGEQWSWTGLTGLVDGATVAGSLALSEGLKGKPDHYDIALTIGPLDLQHLGLLNAAPAGQTGISLHPDDKPGETYKIDLGIKALTYHRF